MIRNPHAIPELCDTDTPLLATAEPMMRQTNKRGIKILFINSYYPIGTTISSCYQISKTCKIFAPVLSVEP